jgi:NADP-reducing hydrogenase subunit HndB
MPAATITGEPYDRHTNETGAAMVKISSLEDLNHLKIRLIMKRNDEAAHGVIRVTVGMGSCGIAAGAMEVFRALERGIQAHGLENIVLIETGCMVLCKQEPIVEVVLGTQPKVSYGAVTPEIAERILTEHIMQGRVVEEYVIDATLFPTI